MESGAICTACTANNYALKSTANVFFPYSDVIIIMLGRCILSKGMLI